MLHHALNVVHANEAYKIYHSARNPYMLSTRLELALHMVRKGRVRRAEVNRGVRKQYITLYS